MWKSIKIPPVHTGLYVVAEFKGNELVEYNLEYALINEPGEPHYWGPNKIMGQSQINVTHWMSRNDFKRMLESARREDNPFV